jgi:hypothetical protein
LLAQRAIAQDPPPFHQGPWPIHNGFNHQPTQDELRALHQQDVTSDRAREIDRLYDQLLSDSEKILRQHSAPGNLTGRRIGVSSKKMALVAGSDAIRYPIGKKENKLTPIDSSRRFSCSNNTSCARGKPFLCAASDARHPMAILLSIAVPDWQGIFLLVSGHWRGH